MLDNSKALFKIVYMYFYCSELYPSFCLAVVVYE